MAIKFIKQAAPAVDSSRSQLYEDITDNHPKIKNSLGQEVDLFAMQSAAKFGQNFQYEESLSETSTTNTILVDKVVLDTPVLEAGLYMLCFSYNWRYKSTSYDFKGVLELDGSAVLEHQQEPKDYGDDQRYITSAVVPVSLSDGAHTVKIRFCSSRSGTAAYIKNARLSIWRAS